MEKESDEMKVSFFMIRYLSYNMNHILCDIYYASIKLTMFQDKVKQIIDRVKSNEVRYRDKHQSHKTDIAQVHKEVIF